MKHDNTENKDKNKIVQVRNEILKFFFSVFLQIPSLNTSQNLLKNHKLSQIIHYYLGEGTHRVIVDGKE